MDYFSAIPTTSFQDPTPPAASSAKSDGPVPGADNFGKHLSDNLNQSAQAADRPAPVKDKPYKNPEAASQPSGASAKPAAPKATETAQAKDNTEGPDKPAQININDTAAQSPAATAQSLKAGIIAAAAQNAKATANATANATVTAPADVTPDLTAVLTSAALKPAATLAGTPARPQADKASTSPKAGDTPPADNILVDGLPLGALGIGLPAVIHGLEHLAPASDGAAAAESVSPPAMLPGMSGELLAEAAKLLKGAGTAKATDAAAEPPATDAKADLSKTEALPAPFAALLSAAQAGKLKMPLATPGNGAPMSADIKLETPAALPAAPALDTAKVTVSAAKADGAAKPDAGSSLNAVLQTAQPGHAAGNGPADPGAANPLTLRAAETVASDPASASAGPAANKTDASLNPLPFATLGGISQTPLQITPLAPQASSATLAAGALYAAAHVAVEITKTISDGGNQFSLRLDPAELGRVDVKLHFGTDGRVTAAVSADHQHTLDLLRRDAGQLNQALLDSGLKTDQGSLSFSLRQQWQQPQGQQSFTQGNQAAGNLPNPDTTGGVTAAAIASTRSFVSNRALDITV